MWGWWRGEDCRCIQAHSRPHLELAKFFGLGPIFAASLLPDQLALWFIALGKQLLPGVF